MDIRFLIEEILGGRSVNNWNEFAEDIVYNNWQNDRKSLNFSLVYKNILDQAPTGSYLEWVKYHNNEETRRFRERLRYRYNTFKSNREIVLYLHSRNYLAGKHGSPNENQVEDLLLDFNIWYEYRNYTDEESKILSNFIQDNIEIENE